MSNSAGVPRGTGPERPLRRQERLAAKHRGQAAGQRDQQAGAEQRHRLHQQRLSRALDPEGDRIERERRRRHEPADESAARLVVAAQQQEDGRTSRSSGISRRAAVRKIGDVARLDASSWSAPIGRRQIAAARGRRSRRSRAP